ncbi:MAG: hypothetical protein PHH04_03790 [Thomasclavelia sp.]|nr:hypothetical protein [Thomasclavelia sp.]
MAIEASEQSTADIQIYEDLFDKADEVKLAFETYFQPHQATLNKAYKEMLGNKAFQGKACEGFLEMFYILLEYHKQLNEKIPEMYSTIKDFEKSLDEIKSSEIYKSLGE